MIRNKASIVGIDNYYGCSLNGCVNDAQEIAKLLSENGNGSPNFDVKLKLNVDTKNELLCYLKKLFNEADTDIALFYFSSNGTNLINGKLVTQDYNGMDAGVSIADILNMSSGSKCRNKIIILDCCYSRKFGDNVVIASNESTLATGLTIITTRNRDESAMEILDHALFTSLLVEGSKGGAADIRRAITPASLYSFVDQSLGVWAQRPLFKTNIFYKKG